MLPRVCDRLADYLLVPQMDPIEKAYRQANLSAAGVQVTRGVNNAHVRSAIPRFQNPKAEGPKPERVRNTAKRILTEANEENEENSFAFRTIGHAKHAKSVFHPLPSVLRSVFCRLFISWSRPFVSLRFLL
jgi:hypothetical protein